MEKAPAFLLYNKSGGPKRYRGGYSMANYTQNYQLHQWEPDDHFLRTDFNTDLEKIDDALGEKSGIVTGTYNGNSSASQSVNLGFQPKAVLVMESSGLAASTSGSTPQVYGGLALWNKPVQNTADKISLKLTTTGFTVYNYSDYDYIRINRSGSTYHYMAVR